MFDYEPNKCQPLELLTLPLAIKHLVVPYGNTPISSIIEGAFNAWFFGLFFPLRYIGKLDQIE